MRQSALRSVGLREFERCFGTQPRRSHYARRCKNVGVMVPLIALAMGLVYCKIAAYSVAVSKVLREIAHQFQALGLIEFMWDREFVLTRHTRILPLLGNLRGIPQRLAVASPVDVLQGGLRG